MNLRRVSFAVFLFAQIATLPAMDIYVSPGRGSDRLGGGAPELTADKTDGPVASVERAVELVEQARAKDETSIKVHLEGGVHTLHSPLILMPKHASEAGSLAFVSPERVIGNGGKVS